MAARRKVPQPKLPPDTPPPEWGEAIAASIAAAQQADPTRPDIPAPVVHPAGYVPPKFVDFAARHGLVLEPGQRALARVLFDREDPCDLTDPDERARAVRMLGCERVPDAARVLGVLMAVCGGRSGKSLMFAWRLVHLAATVPLALSAGEQAYALVVGPDVRLSDQTLRFTVGAARAAFGDVSKEHRYGVTEDSSSGFTLIRPGPMMPNGEHGEDERIRFLVLPATRGGSATRGRVYVGAILEEAAQFKGDDSTVNDKDVIDSISPRVCKGGELLIVTTPWAKVGEVWRIYQDNHGKPVDAVVAHAPTWEMRTDERILAQVERERTRDPWNYAREFGAEFMSRDEGAFFDSADLDAAMGAGQCAA